MAGFNFGKFFGRTLSEAAGFAAGQAISTVLIPPLQEAANEAWRATPFKPLDAEMVAQGIAEKRPSSSFSNLEASYTGINAARLAAMVELLEVAPSPEEAVRLARILGWDSHPRQPAYEKAALQPEWESWYEGTRYLPIPADVLANGIQQGFVPDDGILPATPNVGAATVPQNQPINIDPVAEAARSGVSKDWLQLQADLAGLPPPPVTLQEWVRRGIVSKQDLIDGIRQGHTKTEWAQKYIDSLPAVLSETVYAGLRLRGHISPQESYDGGALRGYTPQQMDYLYLDRGRPAPPGVMAKAIARKVIGPAGTPFDEAQFLQGIRESDIRDEYGPVYYDTRFLYPSLFIINNFVTKGVIPASTGVDWLTKEAYAPEVIDAMNTSWTGGAKTVKPVKLSNATIRAAFKNGTIKDEADALARLEANGLSAADAAIYLHA